MILSKIGKSLFHKLDRTFLKLMGENSGDQKKLQIPKRVTEVELRQFFIIEYVRAQPSLLQVILLKIYLSMRHLAGSVIRLILRRPRVTN